MQTVTTHSLLAMTPAMSVEPLLPPQPTSITLHHQKMELEEPNKKMSIAYGQVAGTKLHVANMQG